LTGELRIRAPREGDYERWFTLYEQYARDVQSPIDRDIARNVWRWILDRTHPVEAIVAERNDDQLVGFAHFRRFPRTLDANEACYLDDLFVHEGDRGTGTARALIDEIVRISGTRGWTHVRWVTGAGNHRAQRFYNKFAEKTDLITYRVDVR